MRLLIILAGLNVALGILPAAPPAVSAVAAAECTGENCPPPAGSGHDCERKQKEQTTS
jgi:hypothetical protein